MTVINVEVILFDNILGIWTEKLQLDNPIIELENQQVIDYILNQIKTRIVFQLIQCCIFTLITNVVFSSASLSSGDLNNMFIAMF